MNGIIVIQQQQIGNEEVNAVDARELHRQLGVKKDFSDWIKQNIAKLSLTEGTDYCLFPSKGENISGRPAIEYILSLDSAKHISMMAGTANAHNIRMYFIEFEKAHKHLQLPADPILALAQAVSMSREKVLAIESRQQEQESKIDRLEREQLHIKAKVTTRETEYFTVTGYSRLTGQKHSLQESAKFGMKATNISKQLGLPIFKEFDARYGYVNAYHQDVLSEVMA